MAAKVILGCSLLFSWSLCGLGSYCGHPEVHANSYTTQDATVLTSIAYVVEFTLKCPNPIKGEMSLYAEVHGKILPVATTDNSYQVSWTEKVRKARKGDIAINLYDEEGYVALRKALRSGEEAAGSVKPLAVMTVSLPHVNRASWVKPEFIAAALTVVVCCLAFSAKSKLLA
ncbi:hypothetical protein B566_EDAN012039 [Ephemera danica]|nr:hypothetical protein B566_EDAN012039 [Ephemera danica]